MTDDAAERVRARLGLRPGETTEDVLATAAAAKNAKLDRLRRQAPASADERRRWKANGGVHTPTPNRRRAERDALDPVTHAVGAAIHADGTLDAIEAAEEAAIVMLADLERAALADLRHALADKRARRLELLARVRERQSNERAARAHLAAEEKALAEFYERTGLGPTSPVPAIFPMSHRLECQDLRQRVAIASRDVDRVIAPQGIAELHDLTANVEQSKALVRRIAALSAGNTPTPTRPAPSKDKPAR